MTDVTKKFFFVCSNLSFNSFGKFPISTQFLNLLKNRTKLNGEKVKFILRHKEI